MDEVNAWCFHAAAAEESAAESKTRRASVSSPASAEPRLQKSRGLSDRLYSAGNSLAISWATWLLAFRASKVSFCLFWTQGSLLIPPKLFHTDFSYSEAPEVHIGFVASSSMRAKSGRPLQVLLALSSSACAA